jgi:hypothetical protein
MLNQCIIPANVLELLHDYAGCHTSFVTYSNDDGDSNSNRSAYHVCVKVCYTWLDEKGSFCTRAMILR